MKDCEVGTVKILSNPRKDSGQEDIGTESRTKDAEKTKEGSEQGGSEVASEWRCSHHEGMLEQEAGLMYVILKGLSTAGVRL